MTVLDETRAPRAGEELDVAKLTAWWTDVVGPCASLTVQQFPSGHSNLTYGIEVVSNDGDVEEWVLRRPPVGAQIKNAHDMGREVRVLQALHPVFDKVPRVLAHVDDDEVLGAPFYVMQRLRGVIVRKDFPDGFCTTDAERSRLMGGMVDTLAQLHSVDTEAAGITWGHPDGYVERQVDGWCERYAKAKTSDDAPVEEAFAWLQSHLPRPQAPTLLHNDFKLDNVVLDPDDPGHVIGVLDWEMSTRGDPLMDVGSWLAYTVEADDPPPMQMFRMMPTHLPGMGTRRSLVDNYATKSGRDVSDIVFYYAFGLCKTAVVAQQIFARFKAGKTRDKRFAHLDHAVTALAYQALNAIERGDVSA